MRPYFISIRVFSAAEVFNRNIIPGSAGFASATRSVSRNAGVGDIKSIKEFLLSTRWVLLVCSNAKVFFNQE